MLRPFAVALFSTSFLSGAAVAQTTPSDAAKIMLGNWEISNADHDKVCLVTFAPQAVPGGLKLEFDKACPDVFPVTKEMSGWTVSSGAVRLVDAKGKTVLEVTEVENGMFEGERRGEGRFFLQKPGTANPDLSTPERYPEN
jgi:hypothetical protein